MKNIGNQYIRMIFFYYLIEKIFRGNSGPMTDGVFANKYILSPNYGNIGYLTKKYNLGSTFKIENPKSLAKRT